MGLFNLFSKLGNFVYGAGQETVGKVLAEFTEKTRQEMFYNPRPDFLAAVRKLYYTDRAKADKIRDRLDTATRTSKPDLEDNVVKAIGRLLPYELRGDKLVLKEDEAQQVLAWVADLDDTWFAAIIFAMTDDKIAQRVKYIYYALSQYDVIGGLQRAFASGAGVTVQALIELNRAMNGISRDAVRRLSPVVDVYEQMVLDLNDWVAGRRGAFRERRTARWRLY